MNRIDSLIKQKCPNGVEYKTLGELGRFYGGLTGKSKEDFSNGNAVFITYKNVFLNPSLNITPEDRVKIADGERQHTLQYGDIIFTGSSETPEECGFSSVVTEAPKERLYLNSFCFFFRLNDEKVFCPEFAKHLFRSSSMRKQIVKTASGVTRFNVSKKLMEKVKVPIIPIEIQKEIAEILNDMSELSVELEAELTRRKQQYDYYRDQLLNFERERSRIKWVTLQELCRTITTGKLNANAKKDGGMYPFFTCDANPFRIDEFAFDGESILISGNGSQVGHINYYNGKFNAYQRTYVLQGFNNAIINTRYLLFYLKAYLKQYIDAFSKKGSVPYITLPMLQNFRIPVPSLTEQSKTVGILDCFDVLTNDGSKGIPAEISARSKQYRYYCDKLLTFKERVV